jgi:hypothetical protein
LGLVEIYRFGQLPGPSEFEHVYAQLVFAGRWLSVLLVAILAFVLYRNIRRLTGHRSVAALIGVLISLSPGIVTQALVLRTELPAMLFALLAFFTLIRACHTQGKQAYGYLFFAALLSMLSLLTKVQTIFLILFYPLLALLYAQRDKPKIVSSAVPKTCNLTTAYVFGAIAFILPAVVMIVGQIAHERSGWYQAVVGWYQAVVLLAVMLYLLLAIHIYARLNRHTNQESGLAFLTLLAGLSAGLYFNLYHLSVENTSSVAHFIDHMRVFGNGKLSAAKSLGDMSHEIIGRFPVYLLDTLQRIYIKIDLSAFPTQPLYWFATSGALIALFTDRRLALQAGSLLAVAIAMETATHLRYWAPHYQIFTDAWVYIACALLIAGMFRSRVWSGLTRHSRQAALTALVAAAMGIAVLSINFAIQDRSRGQEQDPHQVCTLGRSFLKHLPSHFDKYCSPQPGSSSLPGG